MNNLEFNRNVKTLFDICQVTLSKKNKGYASGNSDCLAFFKRAGAMDNETPEQALKGMWKKHLISVFDIIQLTQTQPSKLNMDVIQEKIQDSINYHALLYTLLVERLEVSLGPLDPLAFREAPWVNTNQIEETNSTLNDAIKSSDDADKALESAFKRSDGIPWVNTNQIEKEDYPL